MAKGHDLDLQLKLRFRRVLFSQGYWTPIEVELSQFERDTDELKRRSLTDLDVLGVKFDPLFNCHKIVGDCKSGKNVSDVNRLFWLRGVMDYFGADTAYFLRTRIDTHAGAIAPKMGLRTLGDSDLSALEKSIGADLVGIPLADETLHKATTDLWGLALAKGTKPSPDELALKEVYSYLSYNYWYIESYRNLLMLQGKFERIAHLLDPANPRHILLAFTGAERFSLSLLEMASYVMAQGAGNIPLYARIYLYGGPLALKEKEEFFNLLRRATGAHEELDPASLPAILEVLARLLHNPAGASDVLRHLSAAYLWCAQLANTSLPELTPGYRNTAAIVLSKDVAATFAKATGISEALFKSLEPL